MTGCSLVSRLFIQPPTHSQHNPQPILNTTLNPLSTQLSTHSPHNPQPTHHTTPNPLMHLPCNAYTCLQRKMRCPSWRNYNGVAQPRGVNCIKTCGGSALCTLHRAEGLYSVRLGSPQGLCERFPRKNLIWYSPPTTGGTVQCTGMGPSRITSSMMFIHGGIYGAAQGGENDLHR